MNLFCGRAQKRSLIFSLRGSFTTANCVDLVLCLLLAALISAWSFLLSVFILQEFVFKCLETTRLIILPPEKAHLLGQSAKNSCHRAELIPVPLPSNIRSCSRRVAPRRVVVARVWQNYKPRICTAVFPLLSILMLSVLHPAQSQVLVVKFKQKPFSTPLREKEPAFFPPLLQYFKYSLRTSNTTKGTILEG